MKVLKHSIVALSLLGTLSLQAQSKSTAKADKLYKELKYVDAIEELLLPGIIFHPDHRDKTRDIIRMQLFEAFMAIVLGDEALAVIYLLPLSVLGILLLFAGSQLALTIMDLESRKDLFVVVIMLGITFASNLAAGFMAGIAIAWMLKTDKLNI